MHFLDHLTPEMAIARWRAIVEELSLEDLEHSGGLDNDLDIVREPLETFLVAEELQVLPDHVFFSECIQTLDAEFKNLTVESWSQELHRTDFRWWKDRQLKRLSRH